MVSKALVLTALAVCVLAVPAVADDLRPEWWRGLPRTTVQIWEFNTAGEGPLTTADDAIYFHYDAPDGPLNFNPNGDATLNVLPKMDCEGNATDRWHPAWQGREGIVPLDATIEATIPNVPEPNDEKWIWIQVTWLPKVDNAAPNVVELDSGLVAEELFTIDLPDSWVHSTYQIVLPYNPPHETIAIDGRIKVDQLVIATRCIPEPASLSLLAIGAMAMLRRKRR